MTPKVMRFFPTSLDSVHRNTRTLELVKERDVHPDAAVVIARIDNIDRCICSLKHIAGWWIVPSHAMNEKNCEDFGPYDTIEQAVLQLKLLGS